jgi:hypothetical protein
LAPAALGVVLAAASACSSEGSKFEKEGTGGTDVGIGGVGIGGSVSEGGTGGAGLTGGTDPGSGGTVGGTSPAGGVAGTSSTGGNVSTGGSIATGGTDGSGGSVTGGSGGDGGVMTGGSGGAGPTGGAAGNATGGTAMTGGSGGAGMTGGTGGSGGGAGPACPKPQGQICHEFFANDNGRHQINYVNEFEPNKNWTQKTQDQNGANSPRQIEIVTNATATGGKALMVSVNSGYEEYDLVTHALLNRVNVGNLSVRGAARLPDGNTALGIGDAKLRVVTPSGTTVGTECNLPGTGTDTLRVLNRDPATGYIYFGRGLDMFAVTISCQQQWTAKFANTASKAYDVTPRAGGGAWATTGDPSTVVEVNTAGQIVSQVGGENVHTGLLDFFSGFDRVGSNTIAANWWGHVATPPQGGPHLVEFNPANMLVWRWGTQTEALQITNAAFVR